MKCTAFSKNMAENKIAPRCHLPSLLLIYIVRGVARGEGAGEARGPHPEFGRSVNPIQTRHTACI